jgi:hypothetical protein
VLRSGNDVHPSFLQTLLGLGAVDGVLMLAELLPDSPLDVVWTFQRGIHALWHALELDEVLIGRRSR